MATLAKYHQKRHFSRSPEPSGKVLRRKGWSYVIQKHAASHLHYDFRLELDGVLKSWAIPEGPSLDPSVKRLAVEVEDHPVDYGQFEGVIPPGQYGGGTVMLWDEGTWEAVGDPHESYRRGKLKFQLHGTKLRGGWMLVRGSFHGTEKKPQWLLIKERDGEARPANQGDILEEEPLSVTSGRDLDEIASAQERIWTSRSKTSHAAPLKRVRNPSAKKAIKNSKSKPLNSKSRSVPSRHRRITRSDIPGARKQAMPGSIDVQLATLTDEPPRGDEWLHEVKFDGYRMICRIDGDEVQFISRNHQDWTERLAPLSAAMRQLPIHQAILDGEVVALKSDGASDFQALQNAFRDGRVKELNYFVFDLLYQDGQNLAGARLDVRKTLLADVLSAAGSDSPVRYSEHVIGSGEAFWEQACRLHLEGMVSQRRDQPYRSGRGYDWLKVKCLQHEEFVIGGFTEPSGSRIGLGALLVGFHDAEGHLRYAGKVGTGFDARNLRSLLKRLQPLERAASPFVDVQRKTGPTRKAHWVKPELVAQFRYANRTQDGRLRHASFQGLREDKPAEEVIMDHAVSAKAAARKSGASSPKSAASRVRKKSPADSTTGMKFSESAPDQEFAGVRLTNPHKVLYPDEGITKLDLATYYREVADWILPHLAGRPVVLVRCPDGQKKECFYQKHPGAGTPETLRQIPIQEKEKQENYLIVDDAEDLMALVQLGALEIHAWGSREDKLEFPDRLIFDLDPAPDVPWNRVVDSAHNIHVFLQDLGLESFVKTTGGKGLHLVLPIERRHGWDEAKAFCKQVAEAIVAADPEHFTAKMSKAARCNKIFVDYLRNGRGATSVAPYSTRAKPGATVSTPLAWDELTAQITSADFTVVNLQHRLLTLPHDPWKEMHAVRQSLASPLKRLKALSAK